MAEVSMERFVYFTKRCDVTETTKNYGPALGDTRSMFWNDGTTLLTLQQESSGNITVTLEDFAAMSKYSEQARAALPKF